MKIKFCLLTAFTTLFSITLLAQESKFSEFVNTKKDYDLFLIGGNEEGVLAGIGENYYYNGLDNKQTLAYYNADLEQQESRLIKPEDKSVEYFYGFYFQDQYHFLAYDKKETKNGEYNLYLKSYRKDLTENEEKKKIDDLFPYVFQFDVGAVFKSYFSTQLGKIRRNYFYNHRQSPNSEKLLLFFNLNSMSGTQYNFHTLVLDKNLEKTWSESIKLPDVVNYALVEDYVITDEGKVYILIANFEENSFKKEAGSFEYLLYEYDPETGETQSVNINSNDRFITNLGLQLNASQQPLLAGLFADPVSHEVHGAVHINPLEDAYTEYPFDKSTIKNINTRDNQESAEEYTVRRVIMEEDGSTVFFAESYRRGPTVKPKFSLSGFSPVKADVEIGDIYKKILAVKISPDTDNQWVRIIDKSQVSTEERDIYTSFVSTYDDENYYLIFNNNIKNTTDVSLVTIQKSGDIELETHYKRSDYRIRIVPGLALEMDPGHLIIPVEKSGGNRALVEVKF